MVQHAIELTDQQVECLGLDLGTRNADIAEQDSIRTARHAAQVREVDAQRERGETVDDVPPFVPTAQLTIPTLVQTLTNEYVKAVEGRFRKAQEAESRQKRKALSPEALAQIAVIENGG